MATEKRLIDANALLDEGYKVTMLDVFPNWCLMTVGEKEAVSKHGAYLKKIIQQLPTVDAVEVVRCKDCKKHGNDEECPLLSIMQYTEADDFCSYGERKDNGRTEK